MTNKDEMKKVSPEVDVELNDEELDQVAGGRSKDDWRESTTDDRKVDALKSVAMRKHNRACK